MKITVIDHQNQGENATEPEAVSEQQVIFEYCCTLMRDAIAAGFINFGDHTDQEINRQSETLLDEDTKLTISALDQEYNQLKTMEIFCCPFCGSGYGVDFEAATEPVKNHGRQE